MAQAEQQRKQLRDQVQKKIPSAVAKVVEHMKGTQAAKNGGQGPQKG